VQHRAHEAFRAKAEDAWPLTFVREAYKFSYCLLKRLS
jgi:hypothetical protein